jgi:hypothetical protein
MPGWQALGDDPQAPARILSRSHGPLRHVWRVGRAFLGIGQSHETTELAPALPAWGWLPALSLTSALALALVALGLSAGEYSGPSKSVVFCGGSFLLFVPLCARIAWPPVSRFERIGLLIVAVSGLYLIKLLSSPLGFTAFDEFLHWRTGDDILVQQRLFTPNALLPISPLYPALEIAATAITNVTGLPLFPAALLLLAISRLIFICALFLFFEAVTGSSRISAIACVVYMGNSSFPIFHGAFSYESLAVVFLILAFLATVCSKADTPVGDRRAMALATPFLLVLAATHHLTAYIAASLLALLTIIVFLRRGVSRRRIAPVALTAVVMLSAWVWPTLMGNPVGEYLLPSLAEGLLDIVRLLTTWMPIRMPFVGTDGSTSPLWQRLTMLSAFVLVCLGLAMGFFRALDRAGAKVVWKRGRMPISVRWSNDWLVLLVLLTLVFPITILLRLTESAWELGNRLGPFVYFGVAPVVALALAGAWQACSVSLWRGVTAGAALGTMIVGGLFLAWGGPIELPQRYRVVADALSVESMGIDAARWTRLWLGPEHRFVADRINRNLLAVYGRQQLVTSLQVQVDTSHLLFAATLGPEELNTLKVGDIDYLLVDMRLTQGLPRYGVYFERGEDLQGYELPPDPQALTKFNHIARVSRHFDNGTIIIYGVAPFAGYLRNER